MPNVMEFEGCAGVKLRADVSGDIGHPPVLLLHGGGQSHHVWSDIAGLLVAAGRRVINLDLRGHGASEWPENASYEPEAFVDDIRAVVAQLDMRPVIVAATTAGWAAVRALAGQATLPAAGLVLVDFPIDPAPESLSRARERIAREHSASPSFDLRWLDHQQGSPPHGPVVAIAPLLKLPVLFVRGALSDIATAAGAAAFVDLLPDVEVAEIEDTRLIVADGAFDRFGEVLVEFLERRQPREAPEYRCGSDARTLRDALGCFATGVTIVTATAPDGSPRGATVNSFTSVSLDPPLLLVCIARGTDSATVLCEARHFAVNVLQARQQADSNCFAAKGRDRFAEVDWAMGEFGAPIMEASLGVFECRRFAVHEAGDHFILIGRVEKARFKAFRDPLLYFRGAYRRLDHRP